MQYKHNLTTGINDKGTPETRGRGILIINSELINPYANLSGEERSVKVKELYVENQMMEWPEKRLKERETTYEAKLAEMQKLWDDKKPEVKQKEEQKYCNS